VNSGLPCASLCVCFAQKRLSTPLQDGVFKREGKVSDRRCAGDLLLEFGAAVDRDAVAVPLHRHAQGSLQAVLGNSPRDL
jgi:hypothetical protein